jgi:hypothetical protein
MTVKAIVAIIAFDEIHSLSTVDFVIARPTIQAAFSTVTANVVSLATMDVVIAGTAENSVPTTMTVQAIIAIIPSNEVYPLSSMDFVIARPTIQAAFSTVTPIVVPIATMDIVIAGAAENGISVIASNQNIISTPSLDRVDTRATTNDVVSTTTENLVISCQAHNDVWSGGSLQNIVTCSAYDRCGRTIWTALIVGDIGCGWLEIIAKDSQAADSGLGEDQR